jgi:hypothetical protein
MYEEKPKGFIEELQSLNDATKKRVLIISTIVIMAVVITVWFSYFNGILASASQSALATDTTSTTATVGSEPANGASVWQNIMNGMASIGNVFNSSSQYTVQPSSSTVSTSTTSQ